MVIVNADDFGISEEVNEGIIRAFNNDIISSATIMTNMPYFEQAISLILKNKIQNSIGLHFNIIEGIPLTENIKRCTRLCKNGVFSYKRNSVLYWNKFERLAIQEELIAQYNKLVCKGIIPSHLDSHQHTHTELPLMLVIIPVLKALGIRRIRSSRNMGIKYIHKPYKTLTNMIYRINRFKMTKYFDSWDHASQLNFKSIEIMCHPILEDNMIIDAFTKQILHKKNTSICNYRSL